MADYVVSPPVGDKIVSLTKGTDCTFRLRRRDVDQNLVDWDSEVWVFVDIDRTGPATKVVAAVDGADAVVRIESTLGDTIKDGGAWRAVRSVDGVPESLEKPLMVGWFERYDGGRPRNV